MQIEELSLPGIRRLLKRFEAAANKNQNQRSKYPDDPTKCVGPPGAYVILTDYCSDSLTQKQTLTPH